MTSSETLSSDSLSSGTLSSDRSENRGVLIIISSPSGAGKTTLAKKLLKEFVDMKFSISFTTRPKRRGEVHGVDYFFVDDATFDKMIADDAFAEWATVHQNRYGTSRTVVENALQHGEDVVFDVDWQGGESLALSWPKDALMIFVLPPSWKVLEARLRNRDTDSPQVIERRMDMALIELSHFDSYEYSLVNDSLEESYQELRAMVRHRKGIATSDDLALLKRIAGIDYSSFMETLLKDGKTSRG